MSDYVSPSRTYACVSSLVLVSCALIDSLFCSNFVLPTSIAPSVDSAQLGRNSVIECVGAEVGTPMYWRVSGNDGWPEQGCFIYRTLTHQPVGGCVEALRLDVFCLLLPSIALLSTYVVSSPSWAFK